jgi:antitoxin component YwqK of YwqJK toxin-antitoxin module
MKAASPKTARVHAHPWREVFSIDPRSLALFRILISLVLLYDLALRAGDLASMYGPDGVLPIDSVVAFFRASGLPVTWSLHYLHSSLIFQGSLFVVAAAFAMALLVGFHTRLATLGSWVLLASLHTRAPNLVNGGDMLAVSLLLWGLFLPLGGCWSLDVRSGRTRRLNRPVFSVGSVAILLQIFMMYFCTGLSKFNSVWLSGEALENALSFDMLVTPLGQWLRNFPGALAVLTHLTLWGELISPLLLFVPWGRPYPRAIALTFFAGLHLGIELTMTVSVFSLVSLSALTLFLPREFWRSRVISGLRFGVRRSLPRVLFRRRPPRRPGWVALLLARPAAIWIRNGLCLVLLAFAVAWNVSAFIIVLFEHQAYLWTVTQGEGDDSPPEDVTQADPLEQAAYKYNIGVAPIAVLLHLDQRWDMFATPMKQQYRFIARAKLRSGEEVDVLRGGAAVDLEHFGQLDPAEPSVRWMLHYMGLTGPFAWFAQDTAEYLRRQWNEAHSESRRIESLALIKLQKEPLEERFEPKTIAEIGAEPGSWILRHDNGRIAAAGTYRLGRRQGYWKHWRPDGQLAGEGPYVDGAKQGQWTLWEDPDGTFYKGTGKYVAGEMEGSWVYWHANGQKSAEGEYHHGKKDGPWTWWYDNGQIDHQGAYRKGREHGMFTFWDRNGVKEGEGAYQNGLEDGPWVFYEPDGTRRIVQYRDGQQVDIELGTD